DRIRPALQSLLPGRPGHPRFVALRRSARRMLLAYLGSLVIFVAIGLITLVVQGPGMLTAGWNALPAQVDALKAAVGLWDLPVTLLVVIQIGLIVAPAVGFALSLGLLSARAVQARAGWWARVTAGSATRT